MHFDKILIANRGEIACRVIRTCRDLGIATVAVYSDADADALHVREADEAVNIGPATALESYLNIENILEAAKRTGAGAIHPGYGFLSENADFALACKKAGVVFIGPQPMAIKEMGDKAAAKARMERAGVPTLPGYHGDDLSLPTLKAEAKRIGYPVLLKAVAGGGGKGMRLVEKEKDLEEAAAAVQREGKASFGDGRFLVEKYLTHPRHVEIQVFADSHGNTVYLFERDCSLQRRHQKVVEEAPAPELSEATRLAMGTAAVKAAKSISYQGAGTIEFLLDHDQKFYFMEMNTRLQVEHPVTEFITDTDLVSWQIAVAAGLPLPFSQEDLNEYGPMGHAVEVRVYAEDPEQKFMPATGTIGLCELPYDIPNVRVDAGVEEGDEITPYYDPMIAKIIAWGENRGAALHTLAAALRATRIGGVTTNVGWLLKVVTDPDFIAGKVETGFLPARMDRFKAPTTPDPMAIVFAAATMLVMRKDEDRTLDPWTDLTGWRLNSLFTEVLHLSHGSREAESFAVPVTYVYQNSQKTAVLQVGSVQVTRMQATEDMTNMILTVNGHATSATIYAGADFVEVFTGQGRHVFYLHDPLASGNFDNTAAGGLSAPIPGVVVKVEAKAGSKVKKGASLMVIEAMKTEHHITAPADGTISAVNFKVGDFVEKDAPLVAFDATDGKKAVAHNVKKPA